MPQLEVEFLRCKKIVTSLYWETSGDFHVGHLSPTFD